MTDAKWYEDMAAAMKERDKCITALERWNVALAAAEAKIEELRDSDDSVMTTVSAKPAAVEFAENDQ